MSKKLHAEIVLAFKKHSGKGTKHTSSKTYLGNSHFTYDISVPIQRQIAKDFIKAHPEMTPEQFAALLDLLYAGKSYNEKSMGGSLLGYMKKHRVHVKPQMLDAWLEHLVGWAEIDSLCQGSFEAGDLLADWKQWEKTLVFFSKSKDISKQRASLVLLTTPVTDSDDKRISKLAFKNIETLKGEKDILITKAVSWLLRSLVKHHRKEAAAYLAKNKNSLPKIAVRETTRKIETGKK